MAALISCCKPRMLLVLLSKESDQIWTWSRTRISLAVIRRWLLSARSELSTR